MSFKMKLVLGTWLVFVSPLTYALDAQQNGKYFELPKSSSGQTKKPLRDIEREMGDLNRYIGSYPPRFNSEAERQEIFKKWSDLYLNTKAQLAERSNDEDLLWLMTDLLRQGHNMEVRSASGLAIDKLEECLRLYPESVKCHKSATHLYLSMNPTFFPQAKKSLDFLRKYYGSKPDEGTEYTYIAYYLVTQDAPNVLKQLDYFTTKFPSPENQKFAVHLKKSLEKDQSIEKKIIGKDFIGLNDYSQWLMTIFQTKDVSRFEYALTFAASHKLFSSREMMLIHQSSFGLIFRKYPSTLDTLFKVINKMEPSEIPFILRAVKYANTDEGNKWVNEYLKTKESQVIAKQWNELQRQKMVDPYQETLNQQLLDMLWGEFFVTGEAKPIQRIAEALAGLGDGKDMTAKAASWSLESNAREYPVVRAALIDIQKTRPSKEVAAIVNKTEKK